jgi:hypothetical protein
VFVGELSPLTFARTSPFAESSGPPVPLPPVGTDDCFVNVPSEFRANAVMLLAVMLLVMENTAPGRCGALSWACAAVRPNGVRRVVALASRTSPLRLVCVVLLMLLPHQRLPTGSRAGPQVPAVRDGDEDAAVASPHGQHSYKTRTRLCAEELPLVSQDSNIRAPFSVCLDGDGFGHERRGGGRAH